MPDQELTRCPYCYPSEHTNRAVEPFGCYLCAGLLGEDEVRRRNPWPVGMVPVGLIIELNLLSHNPKDVSTESCVVDVALYMRHGGVWPEGPMMWDGNQRRLIKTLVEEYGVDAPP